MYDSPMRYFGWYYLCNESFRTLKGFQVKSGYDTQSRLQGLPDSTLSVLWSRSASVIQKTILSNINPGFYTISQYI